MAKALTTKWVEALKPTQTRREIPDPALTGLYLVVQPSGAKSWAVRYRYAGKPKKLTLGKWPIMGVADARAAASEAIEAVERGDDPSAAKKSAKAARIEAQLSERDKIKTLIEQYAKRHLSGLKSGATVRRELERHVVAAWGERDIQDITRRDVIDLLDRIADSGRVVSANRVRSYIGTFFNWAVDRDIISASPAQGVKPVAKEKARDRVLSDDEIRWFWRACDELGFPWGPFGKTLLLTAQRLGEVAGIADAEIEGDTWHLSGDRTKNGRPHTVPLSDTVRSVLAAVERVEGRAGLIYTTTGRSPLSGFHKGRNHIAEHMAELASEEAGEPVELERWTFHDLRRTAATGMARLGIPVRVTEAVLNHVSGTGGGIVAVYQRHDYADEKRAALDAWARLVADLVEGKADNVVRIGEAR
ncbi:site-specific integrase [Roseovarius sp.]|uniref:tyrosine-type recombinase/integrase n=1 Tax=Roseovarius sp. TaxID=1486281 RepID=UPI00263827BA|nr:site-specific integrase [Roseovarius sp.]MDM8167018.1 integrase arm-type DNA-binding domain-containing protein [Roseovarius sp.]